ncbi:MAG TPA: hypothetical protein VJ779_02750 [Acetobacteraceae bacterium]|jgi:hypothetical protein|nr:hypothetical protein [Acetobacteraceae bacterium]
MSADRPGSPATSEASKAARLRREIDAGRTGDKVGAPDPAASPLGTDAEAGAGHDEEGLRIARQAHRPARSK